MVLTQIKWLPVDLQSKADVAAKFKEVGPNVTHVFFCAFQMTENNVRLKSCMRTFLVLTYLESCCNHSCSTITSVQMAWTSWLQIPSCSSFIAHGTKGVSA